jgi:hypothetical protein
MKSISLKYSLIVAFITFTLIFLVCIFTNHRFYISFNKEIGFYKYYRNDRVIIYYRSDFSKEFLKVFTTYAQGAINLYEKLNDSIKGRKYYIAEVDKTCGAGCGKIGSPGIEIQNEKFRYIFNEYTKNKKFDSLVFYELGRNFWIYDRPLSCSDFEISNAMRTGFAVFMRNICLDKLSIDAGPINSLDYENYLTTLKSICYFYIADPALNITNALIDGRLPQVSSNFELTASNFWASVLYFLYDQEELGDAWLFRIWNEVLLRPDSDNYIDILNNLYQASNPLSEQSIYCIFHDTLKWNI